MAKGEDEQRDARLRLPRPGTLLALSAALAGVLGGLLIATTVVALRSAPRATAQYLPAAGRVAVAAPEIKLRDQNGALVSLRSFRGHTVLVTFMDPVCTAGCPIAGQELAAIEGELQGASPPQLLVVSVAPDRTAADVAHFTSAVAWRPGWHWLLGSQAELAPVWAAYHVAVQPTAGDVLHDQSLEVIDARGTIRATYAAPLPIDEVTRLIRTTQHTEART